MKNRVLKYLLIGYLPGIMLILLDMLFSSKYIYTTWIIVIIWNIYILIILILLYILELKRGEI